jgi:hypothetical protein
MKIVTLVNNEQLIFAECGETGLYRPLEAMPLGEVLASGLPERCDAVLKGAENALLLVPDYWLGIKSFPLATTRTSLVTAFIRKKLQLELGEDQGGAEFFDYIPSRDEAGEKGVTVYFSREPHLALLHGSLDRLGIAPYRITTPGLLWEAKLREQLAGFAAGGKLLIYLAGPDCFFYFFHEGRFLFSRDLDISVDADPGERAETLAFEVQQSRFLFSQKAHTEIDQLYFVSAQSPAVDLALLAERVGRKVESLEKVFVASTLPQSPLVNPLLLFTPADWSRKKRLVDFAHRRIRTEQEWKIPQFVAIACGALVVMLLAGQALVVGMRLSAVDARQRTTTIREQGVKVREFSGRLDEILRRRENPSSALTLVRLAQGLPANVTIENFKLDVATGKTLQLNALVKADGPEQFRRTLIALMDNIHEKFPGNDQLSYLNVQFEPIRQGVDEPLTYFKINFQVAL